MMRWQVCGAIVCIVLGTRAASGGELVLTAAESGRAVKVVAKRGNAPSVAQSAPPRLPSSFQEVELSPQSNERLLVAEIDLSADTDFEIDCSFVSDESTSTLIIPSIIESPDFRKRSLLLYTESGVFDLRAPPVELSLARGSPVRLQLKRGLGCPAVPSESPKSLIASSGDFSNNVEVLWSEVFDVDYYEIERNGVVCGTTLGSRYLDEAVSSGTPYAYRVRAVNSCGAGPWSRVDYGHAGCGTPTSVVGVTAVVGGTYAELSWTSVPLAAWYEVALTSGTPPALSDVVTSTTFTSAVLDLEPDTTAYAWVRAASVCPAGDWSSPALLQTTCVPLTDTKWRVEQTSTSTVSPLIIRWVPNPDVTTRTLRVYGEGGLIQQLTADEAVGTALTQSLLRGTSVTVVMDLANGCGPAYATTLSTDTIVQCRTLSAVDWIDTTVTAGRIDVSWRAVPGATWYTVREQMGSGSLRETITSTTTYSVPQAERGFRYLFTITSHGPCGDGPESSAVAVTVDDAFQSELDLFVEELARINEWRRRYGAESVPCDYLEFLIENIQLLMSWDDYWSGLLVGPWGVADICGVGGGPLLSIDDVDVLLEEYAAAAALRFQVRVPTGPIPLMGDPWTTVPVSLLHSGTAASTYTVLATAVDLQVEPSVATVYLSPGQQLELGIGLKPSSRLVAPQELAIVAYPVGRSDLDVHASTVVVDRPAPSIMARSEVIPAFLPSSATTVTVRAFLKTLKGNGSYAVGLRLFDSSGGVAGVGTTSTIAVSSSEESLVVWEGVSITPSGIGHRAVVEVCAVNDPTERTVAESAFVVGSPIVVRQAATPTLLWPGTQQVATSFTVMNFASGGDLSHLVWPEEVTATLSLHVDDAVAAGFGYSDRLTSVVAQRIQVGDPHSTHALRLDNVDSYWYMGAWDNGFGSQYLYSKLRSEGVLSAYTSASMWQVYPTGDALGVGSIPSDMFSRMQTQITSSTQANTWLGYRAGTLPGIWAATTDPDGLRPVSDPAAIKYIWYTGNGSDPMAIAASCQTCTTSGLWLDHNRAEGEFHIFRLPLAALGWCSGEFALTQTLGAAVTALGSESTWNDETSASLTWRERLFLGSVNARRVDWSPVIDVPTPGVHQVSAGGALDTTVTVSGQSSTARLDLPPLEVVAVSMGRWVVVPVAAGTTCSAELLISNPTSADRCVSGTIVSDLGSMPIPMQTVARGTTVSIPTNVLVPSSRSIPLLLEAHLINDLGGTETLSAQIPVTREDVPPLDAEKLTVAVQASPVSVLGGRWAQVPVRVSWSGGQPVATELGLVLPSGWAGSLSRSEVVAGKAPDGTAEVIATVQRTAAESLTTVTALVWGQVAGRPETRTTTALELVPIRLALVLDSPTQAVYGAADLPLIVTNAGSSSVTVDLDFAGDGAAWVTEIPASIELASGTSATVVVQVAPPVESEAAPWILEATAYGAYLGERVADDASILIYGAPSVAPPLVGLSLPALTSSSMIVVRGSVQTSAGPALARLRTGNGAWQNVGLDGSGRFVESVTVSSDQTVVELQGTDSSGQVGYAQGVVLRDTTAPLVTGVSVGRDPVAVGTLQLEATLSDTPAGVSTASATLMGVAATATQMSGTSESGRWRFRVPGTLLAPGAHSYALTTTDTLGNGSTTSGSWVLDGPAVDIGSGAPTFARNGTNVTLTVTAPSAASWHLDGRIEIRSGTTGDGGAAVESWSASSSGATITLGDVSGDGPVEIRLLAGAARDVDGVPSASSNWYPVFVADNTPPSVVWDSLPDPVRSPSVVVSAEVSDGGSAMSYAELFDYVTGLLDSGDTPEGFVLSGLALGLVPGENSVHLTAYDRAGNGISTYLNINVDLSPTNDEPCGAIEVGDGSVWTDTMQYATPSYAYPPGEWYYDPYLDMYVSTSDWNDVWFQPEIPGAGWTVIAEVEFSEAHTGLPIDVSWFTGESCYAGALWWYDGNVGNDSLVRSAVFTAYDPAEIVRLRLAVPYGTHYTVSFRYVPPYGSHPDNPIYLGPGEAKSASNGGVPGCLWSYTTTQTVSCAASTGDFEGRWLRVYNVPPGDTLFADVYDPLSAGFGVALGATSSTLTGCGWSTTTGSATAQWTNSTSTHATVYALLNTRPGSTTWRVSFRVSSQAVGDTPPLATPFALNTTFTGALLSNHTASGESGGVSGVKDRWYLSMVSAAGTPLSAIFRDGASTAGLRYHLGDSSKPFVTIYTAAGCGGAYTQRDHFPFRRVASGAVHAYYRTQVDNEWILIRIGSSSGSTNQSFVVSSGEVKFNSIEAGWQHTLLVREDGRVYGFGSNFASQMGSTFGVSNVPRPLPNLPPTRAAAADQYRSYFVLEDGTARTVGVNTDFSGAGRTEDIITSPAVIITSGGRVLENLVDITSGWEDAAALDTSGTVWAWGRNQLGALSDGTTAPRNFAAPMRWADGTTVTNMVKINGAQSQFLMLANSGKAYAVGYGGWGFPNNGTWQHVMTSPSVVRNTSNTADLENIVDIAAVPCMAIFVLADGSVLSNEAPTLVSGQWQMVSHMLPMPIRKEDTQPLGNIGSAVMRGLYAAGAAVSMDNTLWTWGDNTWGRLSRGTTTTMMALAAPAVRQGATPGTTTTLTNVRTATFNMHHGHAILHDGTRWSWGNMYGVTMPNGQQSSPVGVKGTMP